METVELLRRILADAGWTQEELARRLGVPYVTVNRWINGRSTPREENVKAIRQLYLSIDGEAWVDAEELAELKWFATSRRMTVRALVKDRETLGNLVLHSTYHTNTIEGSTMTLVDVKEVLEDRDKVLANRTAREQNEARNHRAALYFLLDELNDQGESFRWTKELILETHLRMMNVIIDNAGQLRRHGVMILGSRVVLAEPEEVERGLEEVVAELNGDMRDIIRMLAWTHAKFEQVHPFSDGNGRVGRLILIAQALRYGMVPPLVMKERKKAYYKYLEIAQKGGELAGLERFLAESVVAAEKLLQAL